MRRPVLAAVRHEFLDGPPVHSRRPTVCHHPFIRCHHVLSAQHLLHERPSLDFGFLYACRECLTRSSRILGGSAAYLPTMLRLLSLLVCVYFTHRTLRAGSAPLVRSFAAVRSGYSTSAHFCSPLASPLSDASHHGG
jgi:hypothetical protein